MLSRQVSSDGVGGVAVQAAAGVLWQSRRWCGVFVAGVVLHVAQGGMAERLDVLVH